MDEENLTHGEDSRVFSRMAGENQKLKQRVSELEALLARKEEQLATKPATPPTRPTDGGNTDVTKVMQLLKHKDKTLAAYAKDLEEKTEKLEEVVEELKEKNAELTNWLAAVQLYREIFEGDPSAMVGLDGDGRIINFNNAAVDLFGERLRILILEEYAKLELQKVDEKLPEWVQQALREGKTFDGLLKYENREYRAIVYPLKGEDTPRAVMLRFSRA